MLGLDGRIKTIEGLVEEGTPSSLTYAALECRLAIEQVCYDRLRIAHDYISQSDLGRWQPRDIITRLIQDVDPHVAETLTLSISTTPTRDAEYTASDFAGHDYVEVGTQVGFDARLLGKLWNALGSFLHVKIPTSRSDDVAAYGNLDAIRDKCNAVLIELRRLAQGTLIMNGVGEEVSFTCKCGTTNKRRADLLKQGQIISCIDPDCVEKWTVHIEGEDTFFEARSISVPCDVCGEMSRFPESFILKLEHNQIIKFTCHKCGHQNLVAWGLVRAKNATGGSHA